MSCATDAIARWVKGEIDDRTAFNEIGAELNQVRQEDPTSHQVAYLYGALLGITNYARRHGKWKAEEQPPIRGVPIAALALTEAGRFC